METLKDIPTISQHFLFFYTQGGSGSNTYDDQIVSSGSPYASIFSSLTGIASVSGEMVAGNFKITLTMGSGPMTYPSFNVVVDHYTTAMRGDVECKYTEPIIFDFPCTVTTKGAAATSTKPAIAAHTQSFSLRVIIANYPMPLSYYGARSSMGVKGDRGSVGVSTTAGRKASKTYATYTKTVDGVDIPNQTVINEKEFVGYPGSKYMNGYSYFWRPGIYTALTETQLGNTGYRIQIPTSTFVLEEYGLPGSIIVVDPGAARKDTGGSPGPMYNNLWVYSASIPEISGAYSSMGDPNTLVVTVDGVRKAYRFAKVGNTWGYYTLTLSSSTYYPPAGVDGWTQLDSNNSAPVEQTGVPHAGWSYGGMMICGAADKIVSPKTSSAKSPAPSYSLGGQINGQNYYEANLPVPTEVFEGYAQPNHQGVTQSFWRYVVYKNDAIGYVLSDTLTPGDNSCPVEVGEFPCALPAAPPALEKYGTEAIRDSILKANNMALNINRKPSAFNQYAILGKADNVLMDVATEKLNQDALIAGGIWGYYPLARQLQVPTATSSDPSYPISLTLQQTQTSNATCDVHMIEDTHTCDLEYEYNRSWRSLEITSNFMPTSDFNAGLFGPYGYDFLSDITFAGINSYYLNDDGTKASGNLVTVSDSTPFSSGMTENYTFSSTMNWNGNANCVSRNNDTIDTLHGVNVNPVAFQVSTVRDADMTLVVKYYTVDSNGNEVLETLTLPYSATLNYQKNGGSLWEEQGDSPYNSGPNRVGGVASIQLVSGYTDKSPQAADQSTDTAQLYSDDLHRVYTTANAYFLHNGKVAGTGSATFKRMPPPGPGVTPEYVTVTRNVDNTYQHAGMTDLASDEACLIPKDLSSFPISPKSVKKADDLFVRMCAKIYYAHESTWTNRGQKLSYCRIEVTRVIDMKSSIMASVDTGGKSGSAITTIKFIERRNKQDQTVLFEKFYDPSGEKFEEFVTQYQGYFPGDWGSVIFPDPPVKGWVDPNQSYTPSPKDLTFVQKHTSVVTYIRRNRTDIALT